MAKINVLEKSVSSKIAAGEVVERPVSVVKELVENSIDARSKNIIVEIEGGGKELIKVTDDGEGIAREDIIMAFKRHATSKIKHADDLFNLDTMGFRGEALASIAAVSHVSLTSKTEEELVGTNFQIAGGVEGDLTEVPAKKGSVFEVKKLFFNTPARLSFLKGNAQEASRITELITRIAMGNPDISFKLFNDQRELFYTSGNGDLKEVIAKVHGFNIAKNMIYVESTFEHGRISGYISPPQFSRGNRSSQTFFVNGRLIKDQGLSKTLERAYKTLLPNGRFPICAIFIEVPSSTIDVNVHPAKTEIKFQQEKDVHKALFDAIVKGLKSTSLVPKEVIGETLSFAFKERRPKETENVTFLKNEYFPSKNHNLLQDRQVEREEPPILRVKEPYSTGMTNDEETICEANEAKINYLPDSQKTWVGPSTVNNEKAEVKVRPFKAVNVIGQLFNTYIILQGEDEFYIIDQHAAHEKILFEQYSGEYDLVPATQELVSPYTLEVTAQELSLIEEHIDDLARMGFEISLFGHNTVLVRSVPYFFNKIVDPASLRDVLDHLEDQDYMELDTKGKLIASMACHTAIKAGDVLSKAEMTELIVKLNNLENPYTCPHGRPIIISNTLYDLEKKFKRVL